MDMNLINILSIFGLVTALVGNVCVNYRKKSGFAIWGASNLLWIAVNLLGTPNPSQILMYLVYVGLNIHGFIMWGKKNTVKANKEEV